MTQQGSKQTTTGGGTAGESEDNMGRSIDADDVMEMLTNIELSCTVIPITEAKLRLRDIPTAYDIDKVVEELEIERKTANNTYNSFNMDVDLGRVFGLEKAIEIVKQGDVYEAEQKLKEMESD